MGGRHASIPRTRTPPEDGLAAVRRQLRAYADRGVFRGLAERPARAGCHCFEFQWLARWPFTLRYAPSTGVLTFHQLLPGVAARSSLYAELKRFIDGRAARGLPEHRRVDPLRATVGCSTRRGSMSLEVVARRRHHGYAVNRAVNLVHEVFVYLQTYQPEYMWQHFDASQD